MGTVSHPAKTFSQSGDPAGIRSRLALMSLPLNPGQSLP